MFVFYYRNILESLISSEVSFMLRLKCTEDIRLTYEAPP
jgi:hypothetical protein